MGSLTKQNSGTNNNLFLIPTAGKPASSAGGDFFPVSAIGAAMQFLILTQNEDNQMAKDNAEAQIEFSENYGSDGKSKKCIGTDKDGHGIYETINKGTLSTMMDCFNAEATDVYTQYRNTGIMTAVQAGIPGVSFAASVKSQISTDKEISKLSPKKQNMKLMKESLDAPANIKPQAAGAGGMGTEESPFSKKVDARVKEWDNNPDSVDSYVSSEKGKAATKEEAKVDQDAIEQAKADKKVLKRIKKNVEGKAKEYQDKEQSLNSQHQNYVQQLRMVSEALNQGLESGKNFSNAEWASQSKKDEAATSFVRSTQQQQLDYMKTLDNNRDQAHQIANSLNDALVAIGRASAQGA